MKLKLNHNQYVVLSLLLDIYENSATYKGNNNRNQSFAIKPEKVLSNYHDDYANQEEIDEFNDDMKLLASYQLIKIEFVKDTKVISKIKLNVELLSDIYELLNREDITNKRIREIQIYESYLGIDSVIDGFCQQQITRLQSYRNASYQIDVASNILKLLKVIFTNHQEIMERELSISVLGDSKLFEKSYRSRVCRIIKEFSSLDVDYEGIEDNSDKVLLEEYLIFANPSYIYFKGKVKIYYDDGNIIMINPNYPLAISSINISHLQKIEIINKKIITVENLTSYHRIYDDSATFIYLSGYHSSAKQSLLTKIARDNPHLKWYHFGDIDPDGYYILKNLIEKIKIDIKPLYMDIEYLNKYEKYGKPLEKNDIVKAHSLIEASFYSDVMKYMLDHNFKLEQEIISWSKKK